MRWRQQQSTDDTSDSPSLGPNWDGGAKTRQPWYVKLGKRIFAEDKRFETHIKYGYHLDKMGRTITRSAAHSKYIYNDAMSPSHRAHTTLRSSS